MYVFFLGGGGQKSNYKSQITRVNIGFKHLLNPSFNSKH